MNEIDEPNEIQPQHPGASEGSIQNDRYVIDDGMRDHRAWAQHEPLRIAVGVVEKAYGWKGKGGLPQSSRTSQ